LALRVDLLAPPLGYTRPVTPDDVLEFWFGALSTTREELSTKFKRWYMGGEGEDRRIAERFSGAVEQALAGAFDAWAATPRGRMALVILLDQMTRSIFRGTPRAFSGDFKARGLVKDALAARFDETLSFEERQFLLMPLLHSEEVPDVERAGVELVRNADGAPEWARSLLSAGAEQSAKYAAVLRRFGRYPFRNQAMGRASTPEETEFLKDWGERAAPKITKQL
jgi:uncharacterized protein (DUF924 family)